jgi:hypothetical protein
MNALSVVLSNGFAGIVVGWRMLSDFDGSMNRALLFGIGSDSHLYLVERAGDYDS